MRILRKHIVLRVMILAVRICLVWIGIGGGGRNIDVDAGEGLIAHQIYAHEVLLLFRIQISQVIIFLNQI